MHARLLDLGENSTFGVGEAVVGGPHGLTLPQRRLGRTWQNARRTSRIRATADTAPAGVYRARHRGPACGHRLWVETGFDSDGDGKNDRMHVDVTRPKQTDTEG
jgi:hypothetical protein